MKCRNCGHESSAKFCPECGTPAPVESDKIKCRKCGKENDNRLKYCPECGKPVDSEYNKRYEDDDKDKNRRGRNRGDDDDDDEGGMLGSIGDIVGKIFGG
jgi:ribosomal protein L37E